MSHAPAAAESASPAPSWTCRQEARLPGAYLSWELWAALFGAAPGWMRPAMAIRDACCAPFGIAPIAREIPDAAPRRPEPGETLGFFTVETVAPGRMTLIIRDRHLDVRTIVETRPSPEGGTQAAIGSEVFTHNALGRLYMIPTAPGHRALVRGMLRRLARG